MRVISQYTATPSVLIHYNLASQPWRIFTVKLFIYNALNGHVQERSVWHEVVLKSKLIRRKHINMAGKPVCDNPGHV